MSCRKAQHVCRVGATHQHGSAGHALPSLGPGALLRRPKSPLCRGHLVGGRGAPPGVCVPALVDPFPEPVWALPWTSGLAGSPCDNTQHVGVSGAELPCGHIPS